MPTLPHCPQTFGVLPGGNGPTPQLPQASGPDPPQMPHASLLCEESGHSGEGDGLGLEEGLGEGLGDGEDEGD